MRARYLCAGSESLCRLSVVFQFEVISESHAVVELPVVGIVANTKLGQGNRALGFARTIGRLGSEKVAAELVSRKQLGIKLGRDFQQRGEQMQVGGIVEMLVPEILDGTCP